MAKKTTSKGGATGGSEAAESWTRFVAGERTRFYPGTGRGIGESALLSGRRRAMKMISDTARGWAEQVDTIAAELEKAGPLLGLTLILGGVAAEMRSFATRFDLDLTREERDLWRRVYARNSASIGIDPTARANIAIEQYRSRMGGARKGARADGEEGERGEYDRP
jgi:hypothetical protein